MQGGFEQGLPSGAGVVFDQPQQMAMLPLAYQDRVLVLQQTEKARAQCMAQQGAGEGFRAFQGLHEGLEVVPGLVAADQAVAKVPEQVGRRLGEPSGQLGLDKSLMVVGRARVHEKTIEAVIDLLQPTQAMR
ncbi:hypothetical protein LRS56_23765 [Pseudomonas poae]|nr:hypothetical protein LRS56_23765 [Pseudomonas poae]